MYLFLAEWDELVKNKVAQIVEWQGRGSRVVAWHATEVKEGQVVQQLRAQQDKLQRWENHRMSSQWLEVRSKAKQVDDRERETLRSLDDLQIYQIFIGRVSDTQALHDDNIGCCQELSLALAYLEGATSG